MTKISQRTALLNTSGNGMVAKQKSTVRPRAFIAEKELASLARTENRSIVQIIASMDCDYQVNLAKLTLKSHVKTSSVKITCEDGDKKGEAVAKHLQKIWDKHVSQMLECFSAGRSAFEKVWEWDDVNKVHYFKKLEHLPVEHSEMQLDENGHFSGIKFNDKLEIPVEKSWWLALDPDGLHPHGRSRYTGAPYKSWKHKDNAVSVRDKFIRRFALGFGKAHVQPEKVDDKTGQVFDNFEAVADAYDEAKSGGLLLFGNDKDPITGDWIEDIEEMPAQKETAPLENTIDSMDAEILRAFGFPEKTLIEAAGVGTYSSVSVQLLILYAIVEDILDQMLDSFKRYVIDVMCWVNGIDEDCITTNYIRRTERANDLSLTIIEALLSSNQISPIVRSGAIDVLGILKTAGIPLTDEAEAKLKEVLKPEDQDSKPGNGEKKKDDGNLSIDLASDCGANAPGGGGFQPGNTCGGSRGSISRVESSGLAATIRDAGGFTYQPIDETSPTTGFALSIYPENEAVFSIEDVTEDAIFEYLKKHRDLFEDPNVHVGGWHDVEAGKVYLDTSVVLQDRDEAIRLAQQHNQEGIYDLATQETIITKDHASRRIDSAPDAQANGRGTSGDGEENSQTTQGGVTETAGFKNWFGNSKVVDESGKPLVVYHVTDSEFTEFNPDMSAMGGAFWFTSEKSDIASNTTGAGLRPGQQVNVIEAYLSIQKMAGWNEYDRYGIGELKGLGYDGIKLDQNFVVFSPFQIKSAIGNRGTFDPGNPNINFSNPVGKIPDRFQLEDIVIAESNRIYGEIEDELELIRSGESSWRIIEVLLEKIRVLQGEAAIAGETLGLLSPWQPELQGLPDGVLARPTAVDFALFDFLDFGKLFGWLRSAVEFLMGQDVVTDQEFRALSDRAKMNVFHAPGVNDKALMTDLRNELVESTKQGESLYEFRQRIGLGKSKPTDGGVTEFVTSPLQLSRQQSETLYRTKTHQAYNAGMDSAIAKRHIVERFPYVLFKATRDNRTREHHWALDGFVVKIGTPEYNVIRLALDDWNCRCARIMLSREQAATFEIKAWEDLPKIVLDYYLALDVPSETEKQGVSDDSNNGNVDNG